MSRRREFTEHRNHSLANPLADPEAACPCCLSKIEAGQRITVHQQGSCTYAFHAQCLASSWYLGNTSNPTGVRCGCGEFIKPTDIEPITRETIFTHIEDIWRANIEALLQRLLEGRAIAALESLNRIVNTEETSVFDRLIIDTSPSTARSDMMWIRAEIKTYPLDAPF